MTPSELSTLIKRCAKAAGFDACGISRAEYLSECSSVMQDWTEKGHHAGMGYMARNMEKRLNPTLLMDNAVSVISLLCNYFPAAKQNPRSPRFAAYAYGQDYHSVLKDRMHSMCRMIKEEAGEFSYRAFTDSAPVLEREWARRAGLGVIGKSGMLIVPGHGSYFFISEIICDLEPSYDSPLPIQDLCKGCRRCQMACPTGALNGHGSLDARLCISYHTIESHDDIPPHIAVKCKNRIYGCDACMEVCPWNRYATPTAIDEFSPHPLIMNMSREEWEEMDAETFKREFAHSAIQRAGIDKIKRTIKEI